MIISRLDGGLGNQLFQYAVGRFLAHRHSVPLALDASALESGGGRSYRLGAFAIEARLASRVDVRKVLGADGAGRLMRALGVPWDRLLPTSSRHLREKEVFVFDPCVIAADRRAYLSGYWQNASYFASIRDILLREVVVRHPPALLNAELLRTIEAVPSVSLHVRRGDYVSNAETNRTHGVCSPAYYHRALERFRRFVPDPHFFVFSDDIGWARENLEIPPPVVYVNHNDDGGDYEDFRLMSHCKHHIIANSTFSWWAAWLAEHTKKVVIGPRRWLAAGRRQPEEILPQDWVRL